MAKWIEWKTGHNECCSAPSLHYFPLQPKYSHLSNKRGVTLIDFEKKFHPPRTFPPSTFIDFLDFFHPPLHVYCIYVLVFFQKIPPSTFITTSMVIREMRVDVAHQNLVMDCNIHVLVLPSMRDMITKQANP